MLEEYNYDPWGKRRNPADWSYANVTEPTYTQHGFTGHEHLDMFDLINMNGRIYDSEIARFLNPDPVIQDPYNSLNYNRYTYCLNNPLKYTDPSGYRYTYQDYLRKKAEYASQAGASQFFNNYPAVWSAYSSSVTNGYSGGYGNFVTQYYDAVANSQTSRNNGANGFYVTWETSYTYTKGSRQEIRDEKNQLLGVILPEVGVGVERHSMFVPVGGGNSLYVIGMGLNAAGFAASAGEYSNVINGSWRGVNGKWNSLNWGGNQWTGARANALSKAGYFKLASRGFFVVGTGISLYQGGDAFLNGNYAGASKSGLDIGMGAFATFGGPFGWIIGGGYFGLDALGVFTRPVITTPFVPPIYAVPDNTYVAPSVIRPWP